MRSAAAKLMDAEKSWKAKHAEESKKMSEAHEDALSKHRGVLEESAAADLAAAEEAWRKAHAEEMNQLKKDHEEALANHKGHFRRARLPN